MSETHERGGRGQAHGPALEDHVGARGGAVRADIAGRLDERRAERRQTRQEANADKAIERAASALRGRAAWG